MDNQNKLNIGWYSFACCEDNTIMFAELLNDYFFEFKLHFNFVDAPVLSSKRDQQSPLDIAFIEGAVNSPEYEEEVKQIRNRSKKVVAIGSCACTGMPSGYRNTFDSDQLQEIKHITLKFNYLTQVKKLADVIPVDAQVPGCPMDLIEFLKAVNGLLTQFNHQPIQLKKPTNN